MIFVWSDTHFNHEGVIRYCNRHYASVQEMNLGLESRWNRAVGPTDTIYLLGDFGFSSSKVEPLADIFDRLNGHKHLIVGNHDEKNPQVMRLPWESIHSMRTLRWDGKRRAELCHYPLETWKQAHHGALMFHGHSHGSLKRSVPHRFDVGADVYETPMNVDDLWAKAQEQTFEPADHHGDA